MASINLKEFSKKSNINNDDYTFVDLALDVKQVSIGVSNTNIHKSIKGKDLEVSLDEAAIANSIFNILNTRPGERFLLPTFGCALHHFVGVPITQTTGEQIGNTILYTIEAWEPRVRVDNVLVVGKIDEQAYNITIEISIPILKKRKIRLLGKMTNIGYIEQIV